VVDSFNIEEIEALNQAIKNHFNENLLKQRPVGEMDKDFYLIIMTQFIPYIKTLLREKEMNLPFIDHILQNY
jgi:DNA-dependent RNA polymerase auxiliary subunit epsilon